MNEGEMLLIKVPASTANLGPGFDSIGLALNLYLTLEVVRCDRWEVIPLTDELKEFPQDETNFIVKTAIEVAESFQTILSPCQIKVASNIPLARGLGSSASAIVAGIELADQVGNLRLTKQQKFEIASKMEGHPDNVGASLFGGLVIGCQLGEEVDAEIIHSIDLEVLAVIPEEELLTKSSRGVLPSTLSFGEAVSAGAVSNLLVAALLTNNLELAGKMMKKDKYHQPYRKELVPHLQIMEEQAYEFGAYGVALSGAGPTVLCFVRPGEMNALIEGLTPLLPEMCFLPLKIDKEGSLCSRAIVTEAQ